MEPIFSLSYKWDKSLYTLFILSIKSTPNIYKMNYITIEIPKILIVLGLLFAFFMFSDIGIFNWLFWFLLGMIVCFFTLYYLNSYIDYRSASESFDKFKNTENEIVNIDFYSAYFKVSNKYGYSNIPYSNVILIKENNECLLLHIDMSCLFLPKEYCSEELVKYVRSLRDKYNTAYTCDWN